MSRIRVSEIGIVGLALGLCAVAGRAANWDQLQQLHPGDKVRVELHGKPDVTGDFGAVTPDSLQLVRRQKDQVDLKRADVFRVYRKRSRARSAAPWIGAAAGFGAGFAGGWAAGSGPGCWFVCVSKPAAGAVVGVVGAGLGTLAGRLVAGKSGETLVYAVRRIVLRRR